MSEFHIDSNVPVPPPAQGSAKYPFGAMQPGDSFFVPGKTAGNIQSAAVLWRKKGWKFAARSVEERGVQGVRIWRIK